MVNPLPVGDVLDVFRLATRGPQLVLLLVRRFLETTFLQI